MYLLGFSSGTSAKQPPERRRQPSPLSLRVIDGVTVNLFFRHLCFPSEVSKGVQEGFPPLMIKFWAEPRPIHQGSATLLATTTTTTTTTTIHHRHHYHHHHHHLHHHHHHLHHHHHRRRRLRHCRYYGQTKYAYTPQRFALRPSPPPPPPLPPPPLPALSF